MGIYWKMLIFSIFNPCQLVLIISARLNNQMLTPIGRCWVFSSYYDYKVFMTKSFSKVNTDAVSQGAIIASFERIFQIRMTVKLKNWSMKTRTKHNFQFHILETAISFNFRNLNRFNESNLLPIIILVIKVKNQAQRFTNEYGL